MLPSLAAMLLFTLPAAADTRTPVPTGDALKSAQQTVRDLFEGEYRDARTSDQRSALAKKLVQHAQNTRSDPPGQYALLRLAKDVAVAAADAETASKAVDLMGANFQVDDLRLKASALALIARKPVSKEQAKVTMTKLRELAFASMVVDRFELSVPLVDMALEQARKARDADSIRQLSTESEQIKSLAEKYKQVEAAKATLRERPDDPAANTAVGRYLCLYKDDWKTGLAMLAKGSDPTLKTLATEALKPFHTPEDHMKLGDGWWDLAQVEEGVASTRLKQRAAARYRQAQSGATGLDKIKIDKRLAALGSIGEPVAVLPKDPQPPEEPEESIDDKLNDVQLWLPLDASGNLTHCLRLGPFHRERMDERAALAYLAKGNFDADLSGAKPTPHLATKGDSGQYQVGQIFHGPAKEQRDHVMYFVFGIKLDKDQIVSLKSNTFTRWDHSTAATYVDFRQVGNNSQLPLKKGVHTIIVRQHHKKSDRGGRSWVSVTVQGDGIQQAATVR